MTVSAVASLWNPALIPRFDGNWSSFTQGNAGSGNAIESSTDTATGSGKTADIGSGSAVEANGDTASGTGTSGSNAFFFDDFTSGNINKQLNGQNFWGGGNTAFTGVVDCTAFKRVAGSNRALKFTAAGQAPAGGDTAELDFYLGGGYNHLWFRWWVYYPSGNESPNIGPAWSRSNTSNTNNNKLIRLGETTTWSPSTIRMGMSTYGQSSGPNTGSDQANFEFAGNQSGVIAYNQPGNSGRVANANLGNHALGNWIKMEYEVLLNTTTPTLNADGFGQANGEMRLWVNDTLSLQLTNIGMAPVGTLLQCGYLYGAFNMFPDNANSTFYLTDFAVSASGRA